MSNTPLSSIQRQLQKGEYIAFGKQEQRATTSHTIKRVGDHSKSHNDIFPDEHGMIMPKAFDRNGVQTLNATKQSETPNKLNRFYSTNQFQVGGKHPSRRQIVSCHNRKQIAVQPLNASRQNLILNAPSMAVVDVMSRKNSISPNRFREHRSSQQGANYVSPNKQNYLKVKARLQQKYERAISQAQYHQQMLKTFCDTNSQFSAVQQKPVIVRPPHILAPRAKTQMSEKSRQTQVPFLPAGSKSVLFENHMKARRNLKS